MVVQKKVAQSLLHQNTATMSHSVTLFSQNVQKLITKTKMGSFNIAYKYSLFVASN